MQKKVCCFSDSQNIRNPRNSSPVYVSSVEAVMTGGDRMEDPGDPFLSPVPALLFLCADPHGK